MSRLLSPLLALACLALSLAPEAVAARDKGPRLAASSTSARPKKSREARREQADKSSHRKRKSSAPARERAERLGLGTPRAAGKLLAGRPDEAWVRAAGGGNGLPGTLKFPVSRGWFVRGFGSGAGGYHQAMDIGGEVGWNVRAAASGLVAYAGDEISGYGNLVMIVHPGGWVTSYAHNEKNLVVAGQKVSAGEVIAALGSTGKSHGPHVHFELLYDGENCDPAPLFRPFVRHKSGKSIEVARAVWKAPKKRPRAVACHARKHHPDSQRGDAHKDAPDEDDEDA